MTKHISLVSCIFFGAYFFEPTLLFAAGQQQLLEASTPSVLAVATISTKAKESVGQGGYTHPFADQRVTFDKITRVADWDGIVYNTNHLTLAGRDHQSALGVDVLRQQQKQEPNERALYIEALTSGGGHQKKWESFKTHNPEYKRFQETRNADEFYCDQYFIAMNNHYRDLLEGMGAFVNGTISQQFARLLQAVQSFDQSNTHANTPVSEMLRLLPGLINKTKVAGEKLRKRLEKASVAILRILNQFVRDCDMYIENRQGPMPGKRFSDILPLANQIVMGYDDNAEKMTKVAVERVSITDLKKMLKGITYVTGSIQTGWFLSSTLSSFLDAVERLAPSQQRGVHTDNIRKCAQPFTKYRKIFEQMTSRLEIEKDDKDFQDFRSGMNLIGDFIKDLEGYLSKVSQIMEGKHVEQQLAQQAAASPAETRALVPHKPLAVSSPSQSLPSELETMKQLGEVAADLIQKDQVDYYLHIQQAKQYLAEVR